MKVPAVVAGAVLLLGSALAFLALPDANVPGLKDLRAGSLPPPPEIRLATPTTGEGVGARIVVSGTASSAEREIRDVQSRVDGGRWESVPLAIRGRAGTPFEFNVTLPSGDHLIEVRAYDGEAFSLVAGALVRRDAPTVQIVSPPEGAGLVAGDVEIAGTLRGGAPDRVVVELGDVATNATLLANGAWQATLRIPPGEHTIVARAIGDVPSLPHAIRVAAGTTPPPSVAILSPREGAAYGTVGDVACELGACILVGGTATGATRVALSFDGEPLGDAPVVAGAWTYALPIKSVGNGAHTILALPVSEENVSGVSRALRFVARAPSALEIHGGETPRPTGTPLELQATGPGAERVRWTLNGAPIGEGARLAFSLPTPGDHVVVARVAGEDGARAITASRALHAFNRAPTAYFLSEPAHVAGGLRLEAHVDDPDGVIVEHRWSLGDGASRTTQAPEIVHAYAERGTYIVNLTVLDDHGAHATAVTTLVVANAPPFANFTWEPASPTIRDVVTLNDTSHDRDGRIAARTWLLGGANTSQNATPQVRFATKGDHPVTLRVLDDAGVEAKLTRTIRVVNLPPVADFAHQPGVPLTHQEVLFADASTDPDGPIARWIWDFGDGTRGEGKAALHAFRAPGEYEVRLEIVDDDGALANLTRTILVADSEPEVRNVTIEPPQPVAQQEVHLRVVATDREGNVVPLRWEFGDGTFSNASEPAHRYPRSGVYEGRVTVLDTGGLTTTFPFTVRVGNAPPVASLSTAPGGRIAAFPTHLLANASDPGGRIAFYRFDADGDGRFDCEGVEPRCAFVYETPGAYAATLVVEDDEGAIVRDHLLLDVTPPPSSMAPPRVSVESPLRAARLKGDFLIRGDAQGVREIARVELQLRTPVYAYSGSRDPWRVASGAGEWGVLVDTRSFPDGAYDLVVRATDVGGGVGFARVPITVENGPRASDVSVKLVAAPEIVAEDAVVRGSAFHPEGVTHVRWRVDDGDWRTHQGSPLAFSVPLERDALKPGMHVLRIEAYRGVSESANVTHVFHVPGVAPILVVDEPPGPVSHGLLRAGGRIVGEGRAQWRLDHDVWRDLAPGAAWNLSQETSGVVGGLHELHLRAISHDGRLTSNVSSYTVKIVNPPFFPEQPRPTPPPVEVPGLGAFAALAVLALAALHRRRS